MRTTCRAYDCRAPSSANQPRGLLCISAVLGGERSLIVGCLIATETRRPLSRLNGVTSAKPGSATFPLPGISRQVVDDTAISPSPAPIGEHASATSCSISRGYRCCALSGVIRNASRKLTGRGSPSRAGISPATAPGTISTATSGCMGRIDDVMNVSGHRISTAEVESALVGHSHVAEAAVVGASDEHTGQAIIRVRDSAGSHPRPRDRSWSTNCARRSGERDLADRASEGDPRGARTSQDPQRQDHAATAA